MFVHIKCVYRNKKKIIKWSKLKYQKSSRSKICLLSCPLQFNEFEEIEITKIFKWIKFACFCVLSNLTNLSKSKYPKSFIVFFCVCRYLHYRCNLLFNRSPSLLFKLKLLFFHHLNCKQVQTIWMQMMMHEYKKINAWTDQ